MCQNNGLFTVLGVKRSRRSTVSACFHLDRHDLDTREIIRSDHQVKISLKKRTSTTDRQTMLPSTLRRTVLRNIPPTQTRVNSSPRSIHTGSQESQTVDGDVSSNSRVTRLIEEVSGLKEEQRRLEKKFLEATTRQERLNKKFIRWRTMVLLGIFDVFVMLGEKKFKSRTGV